MIAWFATFALRAKLIGFAVLASLLVIGAIYARTKTATAQAAKFKTQAEALEASRKSEQRIANKRLELSLRQRQIREQIAARKKRDAFEDQGWGP